MTHNVRVLWALLVVLLLVLGPGEPRWLVLLLFAALGALILSLVDRAEERSEDRRRGWQ